MLSQNQTRPTTQLSPAQISAMLATRRERAQSERLNYGLFAQGNGQWLVVSRDGRRVYQTTATNCSCPDFQKRGKELQSCKHTYIIRTEEERLAEEQARNPKRDTRADDFGPFDEYDRPQRPATLIHPLESSVVEYERWVGELSEAGDNYPAD